MNLQKKVISVISCVIFLFLMSVATFASDLTVVASPVKSSNTSKTNLTETKVINLQPNFLSSKSSISPMASSSFVAILYVFSDPTSSTIGSSGLSIDLGTHSFVTVKNISTSNITIGGLSGIAPNKTVSLGTWGNKSEHKGLWYNLESKFVNNNSAYGGRVSIGWAITATDLNSLNSFVYNWDKWSLLNPCSSFAVNAWDSVLGQYPSYKINAITCGGTPIKLANGIKNHPMLSYTKGASVPYDYVAYYAQGTGAPKRSTQY